MIILATQNKDKLDQIKKILSDIRITSLGELNDLDDVEENGNTFLENALLKAKYFSKKYNSIVISDDTGLVVEALNGMPGIHSARYSGGGYEENRKKLLTDMGDVKNRNAYFYTVIVIYYPNDTYKYFDGRLDGLITHEEIGEYKFGYDPIFYIEKYDKTLAQMDEALRNTISHRAIALCKVKEALDENTNY